MFSTHNGGVSNTVCNILNQTLKARSVTFTCIYWPKMEQKYICMFLDIEIH